MWVCGVGRGLSRPPRFLCKGRQGILFAQSILRTTSLEMGGQARPFAALSPPPRTPHHPYSQTLDKDDTFFHRVQTIAQPWAIHGMRLWITEAGWSCHTPKGAEKGGRRAAVGPMLRAVDLTWYLVALGTAVCQSECPSRY